MGWRGQQNRDDDEDARWRALPLHERYDWVTVAFGAFLLLFIMAVYTALAAEELPLNPVVTPATVGTTVCIPGWTKTVRPPYLLSNAVKLEKLREAGLTEASKSRFELDHRIPLCLGGAPSAPENFQLQPWEEATDKDGVESCLCAAVCAGRVGLNEARLAIWQDWRGAGGALCAR